MSVFISPTLKHEELLIKKGMTMKVTSFLKMSVLAAGMVTAMGANAIDGTISVTGSTIETGCIIQGGHLLSTISLGNLIPDNFPTVGSISEKKDVVIVLAACPATQTGVKLTTAGTPDTTNNQLLALSSNSSATGLAIAMYNKGGMLIPINTASAVATISEDRTARIELQAAAISTATTVTSGDFSATTEFNLTYN